MEAKTASQLRRGWFWTATAKRVCQYSLFTIQFAVLLLAGRAYGGDTWYWKGTTAAWATLGNWTNAAGANPSGAFTSADTNVINSTESAQPSITLTTAPITVGSLRIGEGATGMTLTFDSGNVTDKKLLVTGDVTIGAKGTLTHAANSSAETHRLFLDVGGNLTINAGGRIYATQMGYNVNNAPGSPASSQSGGAGHGGEGGGAGGTTYDSVTNPVNIGGSCNAAGNIGYGGGAVFLRVGGVLTMNGTIEANGFNNQANNSGGGAGGSVNIVAGSLSGTNTITANGSTGGSGGGQGGGGGRIAIVLTNADDTAFASLAAITAYGGKKYDAANYGAAGTVYLKGTNNPNGRLLVNNGSGDVGTPTTHIKSQTLLMDSIVATNNGVVKPGSGGTLDLTQGCLLRSYGGSKFVVGLSGSQILWPSAYTITNATLSWIGTNGFSITSDVTVASGGTLTHEANGTTEANKLIATVVGNLTIDAGGQITAAGRGYYLSSSQTGPGASTTGGGGYGGVGDNAVANTYGSVTNPVNFGSTGKGTGNNQSSGGGVVGLTVSGMLTVNGVITANGGAGSGNNCGGGAGGSVNIVAGSLSGTNTITANGGAGGSASGYGGGGGRIAIVLTNTVDTAFTNLAAMAAYGAQKYGGTTYGAAGTVYLKGTNTAYGRLIVDNNGLNSSVPTLIHSTITDTTAGDVVLRNSGYLGLNSQTLTVYGSWSNGASFAADAGGIVKLAGPGTPTTNTLFGSTTFANLVCTNAGKTLLFQAGKTNTMLTSLNFVGASGAGNAISLMPATAGQQWFIKVTNTVTPTLSYLIVSNSTAVTSANGQTLAATFSTVGDVGVDNSMNSNTNWSFPSPQPKTWNGSAGTSWGADANWTPSGVPLPTDVAITIPLTANQPVLNASYLNYTCPFTIESGASLSLGGWNLTLGGVVTNAGTITATGSETLTFTSNVLFTGTGQFTPASSRVILGGSGAQSATLNGQTFYNLSISNVNAVTVTDSFAARNLTFPATGANVTFQDGFVTTNLTLSVSGAATLNFAAAKTNTVRNALYLRGAASGNRAVLTSSGTWYLNALGYYTARQLTVTNSDATGSGKILYAVDSTGSGTTYWDFGSDGKLWVGTNTTWATAGNWSPSGVPGASSMVFIDGSTSTIPRVSAVTTIAGLTVAGLGGAAATLTVDMPYTNGVLTVSGNVDIGTNATLTHSQSPETYWLAMNIGGNLTIDAGGTIYVSEKGYATAGTGPGAASAWNYGAGHGGEGGADSGSGVSFGTTYGSVTNPVRAGSAPRHYDNCAGGVVLLRIGGGLALNGTILANGQATLNDGGPSGGSVNIVAGALSGAGTVSANGGAGNLANGGGGGGRIAIVLTNANDAAFSALAAIRAYGGTSTAGNGYGAAGTVYLKGTNQPFGRLNVGNNNQGSIGRTLIGANVNDATVGDVVLGNAGYVTIGSSQTLTVNGSWSNAVAVGAISGGTVVLAGTSPNPVTVWGGNTWSNLTIATLGKTVNFEVGKTQTVYGIPVFSNNVTLKSTSAGNWWYLVKPGTGTQDVSVVTVQDSNATNGWLFRAAVHSTDLGNNVNWRFLQPPGTVFMIR